VPEGCAAALDAGCGEGSLARELAGVAGKVTGIDRDPASIELAREQDADRAVDWICGDVMSHPFAPASFDFVASVASLHHLPERAGLERLGELLRPGGTLAVVGLARRGGARDLGWDGAGFVLHRLHRVRRGYWDPPSPKIWPPGETYGSMARLAAELLPGAHYRRHPLFRYSLVWTKP
jgi:SAM-dependent methyltransferase